MGALARYLSRTASAYGGLLSYQERPTWIASPGVRPPGLSPAPKPPDRTGRYLVQAASPRNYIAVARSPGCIR